MPCILHVCVCVSEMIVYVHTRACVIWGSVTIFIKSSGLYINRGGRTRSLL